MRRGRAVRASRLLGLAAGLATGLTERHRIRCQPVVPLRHLQLATEFLRRLLPIVRLLRHRLLNRSADIGRDPVRTQIRHRRGSDPQIVRDEILVGLALMRGTTGDQRVNRGGKGVDVGRDRRRISGEHLGCGVGEGAGEEAGHRFVPTGDARGPEVAQLRFAVAVDEHIRGLDVAVQSVCPMRGFQRPAQFHSDAQCLRPCDPALSAQSLREGTSCVVGHHDEWPTTLGDADLQDVHDVRVAGKRTHRVALPQKTLPVIIVEIRSEHLDGDASPEGLLVAAIDDPARRPGQLRRRRRTRRLPVQTLSRSSWCPCPSVNCRYFASKVPSKDTQKRCFTLRGGR